MNIFSSHNDGYSTKKKKENKLCLANAKREHYRDNILTLKSTNEPPRHRIKMIVSISFENIINSKVVFTFLLRLNL